jgi:Tol biopolymer transport system component
MNEMGREVHQLTYDPNKTVLTAKWSPDGKHIAIGYADGIHIVNANIMDDRLLTPLEWRTSDATYSGAVNPVWSPDSRKLAYTRLMSPEFYGNRDIFIINADASEEARVTSTLDTIESISDWSVNGQLLIGDALDYTERDSSGRLVANQRIVFFDLRGNVVYSHRDSGLSLQRPILSRDGNRISFISPRGGNWQGVFVADVDFDQTYQLSDREFVYNAPVAWSLDDARLLVDAGNGGRVGPYDRIMMIEIRSKVVKNITPFPEDWISTRAVSWRIR